MTSPVRLDPRAVTVLAHPLRTRLLGALRLDGPATATTLARRLATNSGATSYHLRRLAEVGLVVEDGGGTGRERRWRAAHPSHSWFASDVAADPDARAANAWLQEDALRAFRGRVEAWRAAQESWPLDWQDLAGGSDYALRLTPAALSGLLAELDAVIQRYAQDPQASPDARRVFLYLHAYPEATEDRP